VGKSKTCASCHNDVAWQYWTRGEERKADGLCSACLWALEDAIRLAKAYRAELRKLARELRRAERAERTRARQAERAVASDFVEREFGVGYAVAA